MHLFVSAIGTDSGKTLTAAIITQALGADYWKPIQAGRPTDSDSIRNWVTHPDTIVHPEAYLLEAPMSPHAAAKLQGIDIELHQIKPPISDKHLVVEGAGGILVPINDKDFVIDIAQFASLEVVLVSNLYLGSINHTILSINEIQRRNVRVKGIVFNGPENLASMQYIERYSGWDTLFHLPPLPVVNGEVVSQWADKIKPSLFLS